MGINFATIKELLPFVVIIVTITATYMSTNSNNEVHFNTIDQKMNAVIRSQEHTDGQLDGLTIQLNDFRTVQATQELRLTVLERQFTPLLSQAR